MITLLLAGTFLPFLHAADTLPPPELYIELTEAHVCASDEVVQANEASTYAPVRPFAQGDPLQMRRLSQQAPSLQWASAGGQTLKPVLRGMGGNRVVTAFQGGRYDNVQGAPDHGLDFPLLGVDHAEILLGPNTLALGTDALAGVVYFTDVRPATTRQTEVQAYGGTALRGLQASHHGPSRGLVPYYLGWSSASQREYRDANGDTVHGSQGSTQAIRGLWQWGRAGQGQHKMALTLSSRSLGVLEGPYSPVDTLEEHGEHAQSIQSIHWALESQWQTAKWKVRSHQAYNRSLRQEREEDEIHVGFALQSLSSTTTWTRERWHPNGDSRRTQTFGIQGYVRQLSNLPSAEEQVYPNAQQGFLAGFYYSALSLGPWEASMGLRDEVGTYSVWSGLARLAFQASESSHGQLRMSRGSRAPQLEERFANGSHIGAARLELGDSTLGPEKVWNWDAQWHLEGPLGDFQVGSFFQSYEDFIALNPMRVGDQWIFQYGSGPAQLYGSEAAWHLHQGPWHATLLYAGVVGQRPNGESLPGIAPTKWGATLNYHRTATKHPLHASLVTEYYQGKSSLSPNEQAYWNTSELPGFLLVHAQLTYTIRPGMRMELSVDNATNAAYAHPLSLAQQVGVLEPGRQVRLTLTYQW